MPACRRVEAVVLPAEAGHQHAALLGGVGVQPVQARADADRDAVRLNPARQHQHLHGPARVGARGLGHAWRQRRSEGDLRQTVERHCQHQRLGLMHLAARGRADDAGLAMLDRRHRGPQAQVDDVTCHRLGQRAPPRKWPVCQAREQPGQAAVLVDHRERIVGGAMVGRCATHQLPPSQQEVAKRIARLQPLDVGGRRQRGQRLIAGRDPLGVVADAGQRCLQRRQLVPRHRRAQAQLAGGQPARRLHRRVVAHRHAVARQLRPHLIVLGREPGAAQLDGSTSKRDRVAAPADAVARLQHSHGDAGVGQVTRGPQPCQAGPGHDHAAVAHRANLDG